MKVKDIKDTCVTEQNGKKITEKLSQCLGKSLMTEEMKVSA